MESQEEMSETRCKVTKKLFSKAEIAAMRKDINLFEAMKECVNTYKSNKLNKCFLQYRSTRNFMDNSNLIIPRCIYIHRIWSFH